MNVKVIIPDTPEHLKNIHEYFQAAATEMMLKLKWELMYNLRRLEDEINKEGGTITISRNGYDIQGFSEDLKGKILLAIEMAKPYMNS